MWYAVIELIGIFLFAITSLFSLRKLAVVVGLVDKPNARKHHKGVIPLVGGISILLSLLFFISINYQSLPLGGFYATSIVILVAVGVWDDKCDISFKIRLFVQVCLSLAMIYIANVDLHTLGNLFNLGTVQLGWLSVIVTILAVVGAINAFNMVDGIDGLLGGLSIVSFASIGLLGFLNGHDRLAYFCLVFIVCIVPYVLFNLGFIGRKRKVFMGDAGSMLIGYSVIFFILSTTQNTDPAAIAFRPVTALWFIAIPLIDMGVIMVRRIRRGDSPFKPDREHLHHICQRIGLSSRQSLSLICALALVYSAIGIVGELFDIPEVMMLGLFLLMACGHFYMMSHSWKLTIFIRTIFSINKKSKLQEVVN
ncbi:UDP-N-acetylglucosamine--undecaprenyl-phosphate N-acetylglucosaminephosphotransferase [Vibrio sp. SS-MA-C1-2]|uniref:UDP-N-acetylglucosamine--undecaprenyl-phosphate N-acetylglucosaminephosphotransferase n=1 Tax=Vibrio sp. SS-MA-C1-2 TaxID=2908646 RepID=UPI001F23691A|nr:UDP-N-acetylglucosamine--undecaprenyl-phosphate N-acetylglucosaminephosphotransferase [Vibrio sp. SS-MA-C1-2]UJF18544.1 UDP-N-acetylglucosamine--undecaprenyl-phosphate N-acetylglucosaminephosphotransferase [Vibrio sp. SS-MA-C1-2]